MQTRLAENPLVVTTVLYVHVHRGAPHQRFHHLWSGVDAGVVERRFAVVILQRGVRPLAQEKESQVSKAEQVST